MQELGQLGFQVAENAVECDSFNLLGGSVSDYIDVKELFLIFYAAHAHPPPSVQCLRILHVML
jgi:hypothetical protein